MQPKTRFQISSLRRDTISWLVIGVLFVVYAIVQGHLVTLLVTVLALLVAITVHECSHAWMADQLGDPTARYLGRISLNPIAHLDPLGSVMMLVTAITGFGIGWGKPVPVSTYRLRYGPRLGNALVALAGPISNLLVALVLGLGLRFAILIPQTAVSLYILNVVNAIVLTNIVIAMFNLIPLPPLDGHSVLLGLLNLVRAKWAWHVSNVLVAMQQQGPMFLLILIIITQVVGFNLLGAIIGPPASLFYRLIVGIRM